MIYDQDHDRPELIWQIEQTVKRLDQMAKALSREGYTTAADRCRRDACYLERVALDVVAMDKSA